MFKSVVGAHVLLREFAQRQVLAYQGGSHFETRFQLVKHLGLRVNVLKLFPIELSGLRTYSKIS